MEMTRSPLQQCILGRRSLSAHHMFPVFTSGPTRGLLVALCTEAIALGGLSERAALAAPVTQAIKTDHFGYRPSDAR